MRCEHRAVLVVALSVAPHLVRPRQRSDSPWMGLPKTRADEVIE
jgi:hypothetical protein